MINRLMKIIAIKCSNVKLYALRGVSVRGGLMSVSRVTRLRFRYVRNSELAYLTDYGYEFIAYMHPLTQATSMRCRT